MQRPTFVRVPIVNIAVLSLPPMHAWPIPIKRAILGISVALCLVAYMAMAVGIIGLATVLLGLL